MNTPPAWEANTAYLEGARVTKPTSDGTVWMAEDPGTTGGTEPTWPTAEPWTVTDGTLTWGLASSWRQKAVAGLVATLQTFRAANPTLLKGIAAARPAALTKLDLPGAYIGNRDELLAHHHDIRERTFAGLTVVVCDRVPDNAEAEARMDALIDGLMDAFTLAFHAADGTSIVEQTAVNEIPIEEGAVAYVGNVITFGRTTKTEGRS